MSFNQGWLVDLQFKVRLSRHFLCSAGPKELLLGKRGEGRERMASLCQCQSRGSWTRQEMWAWLASVWRIFGTRAATSLGLGCASTWTSQVQSGSGASVPTKGCWLEPRFPPLAACWNHLSTLTRKEKERAYILMKLVWGGAWWFLKNFPYKLMCAPEGEEGAFLWRL